ncbi:MAG: hypothetical protein VXY93_11610, partial [Pseudomonadota bacterium]|nr:hypothetical protein [Pseudomonadota bacterium]
DLDVDGHTNLDNVSIAGVSTFNDDITFTGQNYNVTWNKTGSAFNFSDNSKAVFGTGSDLAIYHDGSNSWIKNITGNITINSNTFHLKDAANNKSVIRTYVNDRLEIYHNNGEKFRTLSTGVRITGTAVAGGLDISGDIDVDGHTNLDNVSVAGVTTFAGDLYIAENIIHTGDTDTKISFPSNDTIKLETGSNYITHDNSKTVFKNNIRCGDYVAHRNTDSLGIKFLNGGTGNNNTRVGLGAEDNGTSTNHTTFNVYRQGSAVERVNIDNFGTLNAKQAFTVAGISTLSGNVDINADIDVDGHTNLDNVSIAGVTTFAGNIDANGDLDVDGHTNLDNVNISGMTTMSGNLEVGRVTASGYIRTSNQLQIFSTHPTIVLADTDSENDFNIR